MDAKHTPGPWDFRTDGFTGDCGIHAEGTGVFAEAFAEIRRAGENARAEAKANARLIAAAPDLFVNAKRVMELLEDHGASIVPHLLDNDDNAGQRLRDAIAKAEGRP